MVKILAAASVPGLSNHSPNTCNHDLFLHYSRFKIVNNCLLLLPTRAQKLILTSTYICFRNSILQWSIIPVLSSADHFYLSPPFFFSPPPLTLLLRRCKYVSSSVRYFKDLKHDFWRSYERIFFNIMLWKECPQGTVENRQNGPHVSGSFSNCLFQELCVKVWMVLWRSLITEEFGCYLQSVWKTELLNKHGVISVSCVGEDLSTCCLQSLIIKVLRESSLSLKSSTPPHTSCALPKLLAVNVY